jgi:hypothetical protein
VISIDYYQGKWCDIMGAGRMNSMLPHSKSSWSNMCFRSHHTWCKGVDKRTGKLCGCPCHG